MSKDKLKDLVVVGLQGNDSETNKIINQMIDLVLEAVSKQLPKKVRTKTVYSTLGNKKTSTWTEYAKGYNQALKDVREFIAPEQRNKVKEILK